MDAVQKLEWLRRLDWEEIGAKLLNYAISRGFGYGWTVASILPKGGSLEDIVQKTVEKVFVDLGEAPENEHELYRVLRNRVSSSLSNHFKYKDRNFERGDEVEEKFLDAASGHEADHDDVEHLEYFLKLLAEHDKVKGDTEMEQVVAALELRAFDTAQIAELTGIEIERIYELRRRFRRDIYPSMAKLLMREEK